MKYKIIVHRIYHIEREAEFASQEEALAYAQALQDSDLPDDAIRSDDLGLHLITE